VRVKPHSNSGQATVEFALVLPLFVACLVLIASVLSACLQVLALNDTARSAARVAITADSPEQAVDALSFGSRVSARVTTNANGIVTVTVAQPFRLWFLHVPIASLQLRASSSMMREPPIVLG
jgi:Flp pilus assembly protein TadG